MVWPNGGGDICIISWQGHRYNKHSSVSESRKAFDTVSKLSTAVDVRQWRTCGYTTAVASISL